MSNVLTVKELLSNAQRLDNQDFDEFVEKIQSIRAQRMSGAFTDEEHRLLEKISAGLPRHKQMRFDYLIARRDAQTLSSDEYQALLKLTEEIEKYELQRLKRIAKLADLRKITLPEVMQLFNLQPLAHGNTPPQ
jgi:hypothetical protein